MGGFFSGGRIDNSGSNVRDIEASIALARNEQFLPSKLGEYSILINS